MAAFIALRHPVNILDTAFTKPDNLTNDLLILKLLINSHKSNFPPIPFLHVIINEWSLRQNKFFKSTYQAWLGSSWPSIQLLQDKFQGNLHSPTNESWKKNRDLKF